jgi:hypothetical protein
MCFNKHWFLNFKTIEHCNSKNVFMVVHCYAQLNYKAMLTTTLSDIRIDIKHYIDSVIENFETLIINRGKDAAKRCKPFPLKANYNSLLNNSNAKLICSGLPNK